MLRARNHLEAALEATDRGDRQPSALPCRLAIDCPVDSDSMTLMQTELSSAYAVLESLLCIVAREPSLRAELSDAIRAATSAAVDAERALWASRRAA